MFGDDPFEIMLAHQLKELFAAFGDVIHEQQLRALGQNVAQPALALNQRPIAEIAPIQRDQVESTERRLSASKQQAIELRAASLIQAGDLAVYNGRLDAKEKCDGLAERMEGGEPIRIAGDQPHAR